MRLFLLSLLLVLWGMTTTASGQDWKKVSTENGATVYTKAYEDTGINTFKVEFTVQENIQTVVKLLKDVESLPRWYDKVKEVNTIKKIGENSGVYFLEYEVPFPFKNRCSTVKGEFSWSADKKSAQVQSGYYKAPIPSNKQDLVAVTSIRSKWNVVSTSGNSCKIVHEGFMNPTGKIPTWAVNDATEKGPLRTVNNMKKILPNYR